MTNLFRQIKNYWKSYKILSSFTIHELLMYYVIVH